MDDTKTDITFGTAHLLNKKTLDSITFGDTTVKSSKTIKFLGVLLDDTLSFKQHVAPRAKSALWNTSYQKCKEISDNGTTKMLMCTGTIPVATHPNKHIPHYHQTISKNSEPSC